MQVSVPFPKQSSEGLRPINLNTDIPQVLRLLEQVFGAKLDADGRRLFFSGATPGDQPSFLWRLNPAASRLALGYVWEADRRIIGNVTILTTGNKRRYLVVNVAVHPDYRRRGIAQAMMRKVNEVVRQRGGTEILLQVEKENHAAILLYQSLQYRQLGSMCTWSGDAARLRRLDLVPGPGRIRELRRHEWREAHQFDRRCLHPDLNWPEPPAEDTYKTGFLRRFGHFLNGRTIENWILRNNERVMVGLASLVTEYGRNHHLTLRIDPDWRPEVAQPLLAKLIRRAQLQPRRHISIIHPDDDLIMNNLLRESNFTARRTLTHMRLDLVSD